MNYKHLLFAISTSSLLFINTSCKKETTVGSTNTPAQSKEILQKSSDQLHQDIIELTKSDGAKSIQSLGNVMTKDDAFNHRSSLSRKAQIIELVKHKVARLKTLFIPKSSTFGYSRPDSASDRFVFQDHVGEYTWNNGTHQWDVVKGGDKIVMHYPADTTKPTVNNATLSLYAYSDVLINSDDTSSQQYIPTRISGDLYIDNVKQASVDYTGSFDSKGIPTGINASLYLKPFSFTVNYSKSGTQITYGMSISKDNESSPIIAVTAKMEFLNDNMDDIKSESGSVQIHDIKVEQSIDDMQGLMQATENDSTPNPDTWNKYIKATIIDARNGSKIGDIEFYTKEENGDKMLDTRVRFTDGSTETTQKYFQPIIDELNEYFDSLSM